MSTRKRPRSELHNAQTPTRYAPSTPHAIRALQQRSGAQTRSVRRRPRAFSDTVRPDSARGILRQLAKITAPATKKTRPTPTNGLGKENQSARDGRDEDEANDPKRPRLTLNIEDSLDVVEPPMGANEDEADDNSELPVAPTPSILPGEEDEDQGHRGDPTITFKSIDFAGEAAGSTSGNLDRRWSRRYDQPPGSDEVDDDATILTERGRRAISEEPTGRLSRYSFGSIRMSDFGSELEIRRDSTQREQTKTFRLQHELSGIGLDYEPLDLGGETEHLENLGQRSPSLSPPEESTMNIPALEDSFQLEIQHHEAVSSHATAIATEKVLEDETPLEDFLFMSPESPTDAANSANEEPIEQNSVPNDSAPSFKRPRRKRVKLTRDGELVPSLPSSLIKRVAVEAHARLGMRKPKLGRDHMAALEQATEWFFEQVGDDLVAYSDHARRKKRVNRSDVLMLMRRQRVLQGDGELETAARELLPQEDARNLFPEEVVAEFDETTD